MSERGAIAYPTTEGGWWGRYHHHDSHPPRLGRSLWRLYHHTFDQNHVDMARALIDEHPAGWSDLVPPRFAFERSAFARAGYRSPADPAREHAPACYCHGNRAESERALECACPVDNSACDPWQIEWVYVLLNGGMFVLTCWHPDPDRHRTGHRPVALVPWHRGEPDWHAIEDRGKQTDFPTLAVRGRDPA